MHTVKSDSVGDKTPRRKILRAQTRTRKPFFKHCQFLQGTQTLRCLLDSRKIDSVYHIIIAGHLCHGSRQPVTNYVQLGGARLIDDPVTINAALKLKSDNNSHKFEGGEGHVAKGAGM